MTKSSDARIKKRTGIDNSTTTNAPTQEQWQRTVNILNDGLIALDRCLIPGEQVPHIVSLAKIVEAYRTEAQKNIHPAETATTTTEETPHVKTTGEENADASV